MLSYVGFFVSKKRGSNPGKGARGKRKFSSITFQEEGVTAPPVLPCGAPEGEHRSPMER